jgi:hypothetical protein
MNKIIEFLFELLEFINILSDYVFSHYMIIASLITAVILWRAFTRAGRPPKQPKRYGYKGKSELIAWKKSFEGTWDVVSRNGFYEVIPCLCLAADCVFR